MQSLWILLLALLAVSLLAWWLVRSRSGSKSTGEDLDHLDTVASWPPKGTRVLTTAERLAYGTLQRAMPGYMILAQVPLARFLKVPTRHSYSEWLRRLGSQCADLVVCDMSSEVVAVVSIQAPAGETSERARKRQNRMARVLKAANIPLHVWTNNALPSAGTARELLLPKPAVDVGATPTSAVAPAAATSRPGPLDDGDRNSSQDEGIEVREPPPSTWFDEFNSGPAPLQPPKDRH